MRETYRRLRLGSLALLTLLWLLMWGSWSWGTLVLGLLLSALLLVGFPLPRAQSRIRVRPVALAWLLLSFLISLVHSSFVVSSMALRPRGVAPGRVLAVRLHDADDFRSTVVAELTSLVPGTVVIDLDPKGHLLIHIIDHCDDERLLAEAVRIHRLERRVARAFGAPPPPGCQDPVVMPASLPAAPGPTNGGQERR
ncbi:Na+/H+ antiporter subunit E [Kribbia dieselivorans]|uniref:Na+/H+ antiporter subunit E n=1 Tax=Kribbia dieselivorans TaxID=331526 RepID=UPI000837C81B|nr:Na+/H+ antiporter subunit E [Kribbia dieselivorans]